MAKNEEKKVSKVVQILKKEYPFENLLLGILGALILVLGVYILEGDILRIRFTDFFLFSTSVRITIFSIAVILLGVFALGLALLPFFLPGFKEMRKVSWPNKETMYNHTMRVLGFMVVLAIMFILYDLVFQPLFNYLYTLNTPGL